MWLVKGNQTTQPRQWCKEQKWVGNGLCGSITEGSQTLTLQTGRTKSPVCGYGFLLYLVQFRCKNPHLLPTPTCLLQMTPCAAGPRFRLIDHGKWIQWMGFAFCWIITALKTTAEILKSASQLTAYCCLPQSCDSGVSLAFKNLLDSLEIKFLVR